MSRARKITNYGMKKREIKETFMAALTTPIDHVTLPVNEYSSVEKGKPFERMGHKAIGPNPVKRTGSQLPNRRTATMTLLPILCAYFFTEGRFFILGLNN